MGVYGGKDFWKRYVFSLEWKSEGVMDDDSEEDEGEEDWFRQGWRSETGSLFQRWGDACRNVENEQKTDVIVFYLLRVTDKARIILHIVTGLTIFKQNVPTKYN